MMIAIASVVSLYLGVHWAYVAIMAARAVLERDELTVYWWVLLLPLAVLGFVMDFAFNVLIGTAVFLEPPKELLFSSRVQRHVDESNGWRLHVALFFARQLNVFDDHIDMPEGA